jgi:hypothetical protein
MITTLFKLFKNKKKEPILINVPYHTKTIDIHTGSKFRYIHWR